jgi:hypothetical protein
MLRTAEQIKDRDAGEHVLEDRRRDVVDLDAATIQRDHTAEPPPPRRRLREVLHLIAEAHHV